MYEGEKIVFTFLLIILLKSKLALVEFVIIESEYLYKRKIKNFIIFFFNKIYNIKIYI